MTDIKIPQKNIDEFKKRCERILKIIKENPEKIEGVGFQKSKNSIDLKLILSQEDVKQFLSEKKGDN